MQHQSSSRRDFLKTGLGAFAAATAAHWTLGPSGRVLGYESANARPVIGSIGTGSRWNGVGGNAMKFGDIVAVCDVDANHAEAGKAKVQKQQGSDKKVDVYENYRKVLDRDDIDLVTIVTPDHWHTKIAIEALRAGKDVYCEKPLTLTIDEGKQICKVVKETGRVFQVGTQQRSEMGLRFLQAIAMIRDGRIGDVKKVTCGIGGAPTSDPIPVVDVPKGLNWDMWLGQAPWAEYRAMDQGGRRPKTRCHYEFRWWYEYSGGKMTDWGAHHVDIASWAIGMDTSGPMSVQGTSEHPAPLDSQGMPTRDDMYNVAHSFDIDVKCPGGIDMLITNSGDNGLLFEGTDGRFFVNRGKITGAPVEALESNPLPEDAISQVYGGKTPGNHMGNFIECCQSREKPISDVFTHHRALTVCHLANIAIRLDRKLKWDAKAEQIVGDEEANAWLSRKQRKGYEINA